MESCLRFSVIVSLTLLIAPAFCKQPAKSAAEPTEASAADANLPPMPFMAEITSDDTLIRSGAGTNYYDCGKLHKGDKVKVVGSRYSWLQIVPPGGSYAWISKQYVQVEPPNSAGGTVIGEGVRVYAGSNDVQPMHSTSLLVKLNKGDTVSLLGEEKDGYYKIAPPEWAYLWVSSQNAKALASLVAPAQPATSVYTPPPPPFPSITSPNTPSAAVPSGLAAPKEPNVSEDNLKTKEVLALKEKVDALKAKPVEQQDWTQIKKSLMEIASDKQTPVAARNAQALLKTIARCELAKEVADATKTQNEQFGQTSKQIEEARASKLAEFDANDQSKFAIIGVLKGSSIFAEAPGIKYYRIVDNEDKTVCYARPEGDAVNMDMSGFIGKKVGLVGTINPNAELGGALVEFTNVVALP
ncbi:MAG: SH3 domain-containing protein [Sedimentisphaerales bacterium]